MDPVTVTVEVTKRFGPVVALDRMSLAVPGGQVVGCWSSCCWPSRRA